MMHDDKMTEPECQEIVFVNQYARWFFQARTVHTRQLQVMARGVALSCILVWGSHTSVHDKFCQHYLIVILIH